MTTTAAPSRASGSFTITMGLLSIPLSVYTGTEPVSISRSQFLADGTTVGQAPCVKISEGVYGDKVDKSLIVKRFQTSEGLVDLSDSEIDACSTAVPGTADVLAVHSVELLRNGHYLPNGKVWQVRAAGLMSGSKKKPNPGGEKTLALLLAALREKDVFLLLRWSRDGSVYASALLPSGRLVGLYHDEEIRAERDLPCSDLEFKPEEIALAGALLDAFTEAEPVPLVNESVAAVEAYAESKAKGGNVAFTVTAQAAPTEAFDLLAQLRASVEAVQKPKKKVAKKVDPKAAPPVQDLPAELPANVVVAIPAKKTATRRSA